MGRAGGVLGGNVGRAGSLRSTQDGPEADILRQGSRRPIEGHGRWTYR